jgi:carbohydrate binding protein with CBM5/12 domain
MHRARHAGASFALGRPRTLILLAVAGVGLAGALWLPTRYDTASANENPQGRQSQDQDRNWRHNHHHQSASPSADPSGANPSESPTAAPTTSQPTTEPPPSDGPSSEPTTSPPTTEPPATTAPASPTPTAPEAPAWAAFTNYTAGQLVSFQGKVYQVQQTHTSLPGWEPPKLPELFKLV